MPSFEYLKRLDLSSSLKGDAQVLAFASSTAYQHLEFLKLKNCGIGNLGLTALLGSSGLRRLKVLILSKNQLTKLIMPEDDLKGTTQASKKREFMDLQVLDVRENLLGTHFKQYSSRFLKNAIILGWDNSAIEVAVDSHLGKTKIYSGL